MISLCTFPIEPHKTPHKKFLKRKHSMHQKHLSFRLNTPSAIPRQCTQNRREGRERNIAEGKKTPPELIPKLAQTARAEPMYSRGTSRSRRRRRPGTPAHPAPVGAPMQPDKVPFAKTNSRLGEKNDEGEFGEVCLCEIWCVR